MTEPESEPVIDEPQETTTVDRAPFNAVDLVARVHELPEVVDDLAADVTEVLIYCISTQRATLGMGIVDTAAGLHRIAVRLSNLQWHLLQASSEVAAVIDEVRTFSQTEQIPTPRPPGYPEFSETHRPTVDPLYTLRDGDGDWRGSFADLTEAEERASQLRADGRTVTIIAPTDPDPATTDNAENKETEAARP